MTGSDERALREAEVFSEIAGWLNASLDLPTVLGTITEAARELTDAEIAIVAVAERGGAADGDPPLRMTFRQASGLRDEALPAAIIEHGRGAGGIVLDTGRPFRTEDYLNDARIADKRVDLATTENVRALMAAPVLRGARIEGLIVVCRRTPRPFSDRDETTLAKLAPYAGMAIHNAELFAEVETARQRLELLSRGLLEVQETERRELARELHDQMGQLLTALTFNLEGLRRADRPRLEATVTESLAIVQRLLHGVRDLSFRLRPAMLDDMGLLEALRWFVDREAGRAGVRATLTGPGTSSRLPAALETAIFRIVQEALTNVARHAKAKTVAVEVKEHGGAIHLVVADDGVGFDADAARRRLSLGLLGMEERAARLGGTLEIESVPGHGTEVRARIPLERSAAA